MYIPKHFEVTDTDEIFSFIEANAFGQLISTVAGRYFSTHLPFLIANDRGRLFTHLARQNPQHEQDQKQVIRQLKSAGSNRLVRAMERNEI